MNEKLILEDGTIFEGISLGHFEEKCGPVILNTAVVGYQEIMTDPANAGKILVLTYPLIGNYGINQDFNQSSKAWTCGLIIKEASQIASNFQAQSSLDQFLNQEKVSCLSGVDTRTLAVKIRDDGEMWGLLTSSTEPLDILTEKIKLEKEKQTSYLSQISLKEIKTIFTPKTNSKGKVVIIDLGITKNFITQLKKLDFVITLVPYNTPAEKIMDLDPSGVIISSGPEEDPAITEIISIAKELLGKIPLLGISLGHQIIAKALGSKTKKMKVGHRGVNYPVISPDSFKGEITVQNHGYIVDEQTLSNKDIKIEEINLNDKSIEKMSSTKLKFISVQYYPSSPGFEEVNNIFNEFSSLILKKGELIHA